MNESHDRFYGASAGLVRSEHNGELLAGLSNPDALHLYSVAVAPQRDRAKPTLADVGRHMRHQHPRSGSGTMRVTTSRSIAFISPAKLEDPVVAVEEELDTRVLLAHGHPTTAEREPSVQPFMQRVMTGREVLAHKDQRLSIPEVHMRCGRTNR